MKYTVVSKVTISLYTKVEAETEKEAIIEAEERAIEQNSFSGDNAKYAWVSDEYDGIPYDIEIEN